MTTEITLATISQQLIQLQGQINARFEQIEARLDKIEARLDKIEVRLEQVEARLEKIEVRLEQVESRLVQIDHRLDAMDARFDAMDARFDNLEETLYWSIQETIDHFAAYDSRFDSLDCKLDNSLAHFANRYNHLSESITQIEAKQVEDTRQTRYICNNESKILFERLNNHQNRLVTVEKLVSGHHA